MQEKPLELTRELARFIVETDKTDIPSYIFEHAKIAFMDWLGVAMAAKDESLVKKLIRYADLLGGNEQATILGHGIKKTISQAALINGAASHALDYDDSMAVFAGHPSVTLFPSLLALAEWKGKTGSEFLTAFIIGIEIEAALGACGGMAHYMSGWHSTSTLGHFASAAGCSRLMGLDEQQTVYAFGIAGTQACGLKISFGSMCKPFHAGRASEAGLTASMLAAEGFTGAEDILEGPGGFLQVLNGKLNEGVMGILGKTWNIEDLAQKYHASCHATHSPIEGVYSIVKEEGLSPRDIKSIRIFTSRLSLDAAGKTEPKSGLEGKFSIPYCVANALLRGNTGMQAFTDEKVNDPEVREYMKKISLELDQDFKMVDARVEVEINSGKVHSRVVNVIEDIPELELKRSKIKDKFTDLCSPILGDKKTEGLVEAILSLEKIDNMQTFIGQIQA